MASLRSPSQADVKSSGRDSPSTRSSVKFTSSDEGADGSPRSSLQREAIDDASREGWLKKKGTWSSWKDVYVVVKGGFMIEYKKEGSDKPTRVQSLEECTLQLAHLLTGTKNTFAISSRKKKSQPPTYWKCDTDSELVQWLTVLRAHCLESELEWHTDELLDSLGEAAVLADHQMMILGANDAALKLLGYSRSQLIGKSAEVLMPPGIAKMHASYVKRYFDTGEKRLIGKPRKLTVVRANGSEFTASICLGEAPPAAQGEPLRFVARLRTEVDEVTSEALAASISSIIETTLRTAQEDMLKQLQSELRQVDSALQQSRTQPASTLTSDRPSFPRASGSDTEEDDHSVSDENYGRVLYEHVEVHERLAEGGGSGAVIYNCSVDGWGCCMKEIPTTGVTGASLQSILNEVTVLEKLPYHKNLCRYLFHRVTPNSVQIFIKRYNSNLTHELRRRVVSGEPMFGAPDVARLALDIINGLTVLHSRKLLHRDLKSDNVFVTLSANGGISYLSLGDFDAAKSVGREAAAHSVVGTPGYMAPEILLGQKYSFPVDIFAFGMVLYEIITMHRPFEEEKNSFRISQYIIEGKRPALPATLGPEYGDLVTLVKKCLRTKADRRPTLASCKSLLLKYYLSQPDLAMGASTASASSSSLRK